MKLRTALIIAALASAGPAMAQSAPPSLNQPAQHAPGTPAQPGQTSDSAKAEKLDPAKDAAIRHLLDLTEISKMGDNMQAALTQQVQQGVSRALQQDQVPKFMATFKERFAAAAPSAPVTDATVHVYAKHFTSEDIAGLTKFYESPLGQKLVKESPLVVRESQEAGMQIDGKAAMTVLRGMQDDYPVLKQMLPPDPNAKPEAAPAASGEPGAAPAPAPAPAPRATPATPATPAPQR
jgi:hypothetical protein